MWTSPPNVVPDTIPSSHSTKSTASMVQSIGGLPCVSGPIGERPVVGRPHPVLPVAYTPIPRQAAPLRHIFGAAQLRDRRPDSCKELDRHGAQPVWLRRSPTTRIASANPSA